MAGIVVAMILMPDGALFPLIGLGVGLVGVWLLGKSTVGGAAVILVGVGFVAWGIAIRIKESRQADEDADKAADEISRRFRG